jgi:uncharacterized membrane protein YkvA (DUF1232 family)
LQAKDKLSENNPSALLSEGKEKISLLIRMVNAYRNGDYKDVPFSTMVKIVAAVVYFVMIIDAVPDFIPVLGLTDDFAVVFWVADSIKKNLEHFQVWEKHRQMVPVKI